jgi:hypothetical protein
MVPLMTAFTNDIERDPDAKSTDPFFLFHNYPKDSVIYIYTHTYRHEYINIYIYIHAYINIYTYIHTYTYIHIKIDGELFRYMSIYMYTPRVPTPSSSSTTTPLVHRQKRPST